ncbi:disulfide bond formation protein B [Francisella frigiditurris]|uniref:Disulfide bond formation DsbB family protein n=1 Tax=Francisella frigiditurris TaxID=1542390 RepID=A0A1J0KTE8_9GAMM|nr:disulfide bond formation protein B [Francisella frigiditurris]APC97037.1 disulfide bond formation DsbB family protein [Francisella frigiditurris]
MEVRRKILNTLDSIAIIGLTIVLCMAFYYQLFLNELPCALCVFQRIALCLLTFGLTLNLIHGNQSKHYFFVVLVAVLNASMALTQILLHIVPGTGNYGDAFLSLHMYTWNFIISAVFIIYSAVAGLFSPNEKIDIKVPLICKIAVTLIIILTLANTISVFIECGPHLCPSDPENYWLLTKKL